MDCQCIRSLRSRIDLQPVRECAHLGRELLPPPEAVLHEVPGQLVLARPCCELGLPCLRQIRAHAGYLRALTGERRWAHPTTDSFDVLVIERVIRKLSPDDVQPDAACGPIPYGIEYGLSGNERILMDEFGVGP